MVSAPTQRPPSPDMALLISVFIALLWGGRHRQAMQLRAEQVVEGDPGQTLDDLRMYNKGFRVRATTTVVHHPTTLSPCHRTSPPA